MISFITPEELHTILEKESRPVLIACLDRRMGFQNQKGILEYVRSFFGHELTVCVLDAEQINFAGNRFGIRGAPTFILFNKGIRQDRFLGQIDEESMTAFVQANL